MTQAYPLNPMRRPRGTAFSAIGLPYSILWFDCVASNGRTSAGSFVPE